MDFSESWKNLKKFRVKKQDKESIEPEEIFLDAKISETSLDERKFETPINRRTFVMLFVFSIFCLTILFGKIIWLQIYNYGYYNLRAEENRTRITLIEADRGIIYDRNGKILVSNAPAFDLVVEPRDLPKKEESLNIVLYKVASILERSVLEIKNELSDSGLEDNQKILIESNIDHEKLLLIKSTLNELPGFSLRQSSLREYPLKEYTAHVLGYIGKLTRDDLKKYQDYFLIEKVGKIGLELEYEKFLHGEPGRKEIEVDVRGEQKYLLNHTPPISGNSLILTLDADLQKELYDRINEVLQNLKSNNKKFSGGAAAVALDPRDGKILALVSLPSYDNNLFSKRISQSEFTKLANDESQPLFNRAIAGLYPSGSVVKPMIASAALQEEVISPLTTINCLGAIHVGSFKFGDWTTHGPINVIKAIAQSCDVFFYHIGGGYGQITGLGIDRMDKYLNDFGFGNYTRIDLPGERSGLVPSAQWKKQTKGENWYIGDSYHLSIGQGDFLVTPLQMAMATAAVANGGNVYRPQLVDKIVSWDKNIIREFSPEVLNKDFIDIQNIEIARRGMRDAVVYGSSYFLRDLPVAAAAKTGTAQTGKAEEAHAWFTAFAPFDNPQIVLSIIIENGGEGSRVAAPIAKDVLKWYFNRDS